MTLSDSSLVPCVMASSVSTSPTNCPIGSAFSEGSSPADLASAILSRLRYLSKALRPSSLLFSCPETSTRDTSATWFYTETPDSATLAAPPIEILETEISLRANSCSSRSALSSMVRSPPTSLCRK